MSKIPKKPDALKDNTLQVYYMYEGPNWYFLFIHIFYSLIIFANVIIVFILPV